MKNFELYFLSSSYFHYKKKSTKRDELHLYRFEFDLNYEIYNLLVTPLYVIDQEFKFIFFSIQKYKWCFLSLKKKG